MLKLYSYNLCFGDVKIGSEIVFIKIDIEI